MTKFLSEIFQEVRNSTTNEHKIELLRHYQRQDTGKLLLMALSYTYNDRYVFFADSVPPYSSDGAPIGLNPTTLYTCLPSLKVLLRDYKTDFRRKERILIQFLEGMHRNECDVLAGIITKDLSHLGVSRKLVQEAFPGLLHESENLIKHIVETATPITPNVVGNITMTTPETVKPVVAVVGKKKPKKGKKRIVSPELKLRLQQNIAKAREKRAEKIAQAKLLAVDGLTPNTPNPVPV